MSVRITAGKYKNRILHTLAGIATRPTTESMRGSIFSALCNHKELTNARVLDLFCGSGAFGIESVSRGASHATLVDSSRNVVSEIQRSIKMLDAASEIDVVQDLASKFITRTKHEYDVVFADPPYELHICNAICEMLDKTGTLANNAVVVLEFGTAEFLLPHDNFSTVWRKETLTTTVEILSYSKP